MLLFWVLFYIYIYIFFFKFQGEQVIEKIENVIGVIEGAEEPDRYVVRTMICYIFT